ncbi:thermonuclease family protein [Variovorax saccharolyticus]|uniref:thermonuclease family protein n=1 Tax=Variovorax saccharolyticus TaxID=3053516 RepID=UPI00257766CB|nr:thermonuclease family protein [Variovorax sp. J31P216]MDM0023830.1 thermonuclease family protein [Variovorax sp. J31P216]
MQFLFALFSLLLPVLSHAAQSPDHCVIVGVIDGDTVTARCGDRGAHEQIRVRLHGIDAPEKRQAYGMRAKQVLSGMVFGKPARLDCVDIDRYARRVCKVMVAPASAPGGPQTLDAGLAMLTVGMAWWYRSYAGEQAPEERGRYEFAEFEAKSRRAGLWRDPHAQAPWSWRKAEHAGPR